MYRIVHNLPIILSNLQVDVSDIVSAIESTNHKIYAIANSTQNFSVDIFKIIDLRTLSGAIGETFVSEMAKVCPALKKNPSIDGYPDLVQCSTPEMLTYFKEYASKDSKEAFYYGGIEVKNTFGYKKSKVELFNGEQRIDFIKKDLEWKAHHQKTNHLLGLYSDFINGYPTIVAAFYSDKLVPDDWTIKAEPKGNSAMTSFSTMQKTGFIKMLRGMLVCLDDSKYINFFTREV